MRFETLKHGLKVSLNFEELIHLYVDVYVSLSIYLSMVYVLTIVGVVYR